MAKKKKHYREDFSKRLKGNRYKQSKSNTTRVGYFIFYSIIFLLVVAVLNLYFYSIIDNTTIAFILSGIVLILLMSICFLLFPKKFSEINRKRKL